MAHRRRFNPTILTLIVALLSSCNQHNKAADAFLAPQKRPMLHSAHPTRTTAPIIDKTHNPFHTSNSITPTSLSLQTDANLLAQGLGYLVASGSLLIYTPIAVRVSCQQSADGLTLSTWYLKLASYLCSDIYAYTRGYNLSTYAETLIITAEATVILCLVAYYQQQINLQFASLILLFISTSSWAATSAPPEVVALGQIASVVLNTGALLPQLSQNYQRKSSGDYSPVTSGLASLGCIIRLFTTVQLNNSDPLLLVTYGVALLLNGALCSQVLYYGMVVEGQSLQGVLTADVAKSKKGEEVVPQPQMNEGGGSSLVSGGSQVVGSATRAKKRMIQQQVKEGVESSGSKVRI